MKIQLKKRTPAQETFVKNLFTEWKLNELKADNWPEKMQDKLLNVQFLAHENYYKENFPEAEDYIIYYEDKMAGRFIFNKGEDNWHLADIIISPEFQNKGIAKEVLLRTIRTAASKGKLISCKVDKNNPIIDFYKRLGFEIKKDDGTEYYMEILKSSEYYS